LDLITNFFQLITAPAYPLDATHCTYQDGFVIVNNPSSNPTGNFNISDNRDALNWQALNFGNAESSPDAINALISTGKILWLFGLKSMECWYNSGASDFTFQRISGATSDIGCFAPYSLASISDNVFWLGSNEQGFGQIFMNQGYSPQAISTSAIDQEITTYPNINDATGFCFQEGGHKFYLITFQEANKTWVYDLTTASWFEWAYTDFQFNVDGKYLGNAFAFFNGKNYVSDSTSGNIYEVDSKTLSDNENPMKCLRNSPHLINSMDRVYYLAFQIDMETGVGATNGDDSNPQAQLRWSDDGGHTWSNQAFQDIGLIGEYSTRVKFNRLGQARTRIFELTITEAIKITLLNAYIKSDAVPNG